ncbi:MAG TPA: hypothetical protein VKQ36_15570 [Ktedonobacterales bacterium]|nr:hypothetical protein [Ktedonobacterales bacterium]
MRYASYVLIVVGLLVIIVGGVNHFDHFTKLAHFALYAGGLGIVIAAIGAVLLFMVSGQSNKSGSSNPPVWGGQ